MRIRFAFVVLAIGFVTPVSFASVATAVAGPAIGAATAVPETAKTEALQALPLHSFLVSKGLSKLARSLVAHDFWYSWMALQKLSESGTLTKSDLVTFGRSMISLQLLLVQIGRTVSASNADLIAWWQEVSGLVVHSEADRILFENAVEVALNSNFQGNIAQIIRTYVESGMLPTTVAVIVASAGAGLLGIVAQPGPAAAAPAALLGFLLYTIQTNREKALLKKCETILSSSQIGA